MGNTGVVGRLRATGRSGADDESGEHTAERGRVVTPAVSLPTGRAIVGGLLVAMSGLGIFAAHHAATTPDRTEWLVVRRSVAPGSVLVADDLAIAPMDLPATTRDRAVAVPADAIGRIALVPLSDGDLLLRSAIAAPGHDPDRPGRRLGLALDLADALGGDIAVGDRVDVVAVPTPEESSVVVASGALVTAVGSPVDGFGAGDRLQLTLDVADEETARRVIDAHARGGVTLIAASTIAVSDPTP